MSLARLALCVMLLLAGPGPAWAASGLDEARQAVSQVQQEATALREEQARLRSALSELSAAIEARKAQARGKVILGGSLQEQLKKSQQLSDKLSGLAKSLAEVEARGQTHLQTLLSRLGEELTLLRGRWDSAADKTARRALLDQMRALKQERAQARAALQVAPLQPVAGAEGSEDVEELLEQADALRDNEDRVRQRLKALETQLADAREERDFDRRMYEFLGDENLFDDSDRRLRMQRATPLAAGAANFDANVPVSTEASTPPSLGGGGTPSAPAPATSSAPAARVENPKGGSQSARDGQPQLDARVGTAASGVTSLAGLETEKKRLEKLAEELKARASKLEGRARSLR